MDHHNKDTPKNKGDRLMATVTGLPRDLDEYVDFSMIAQAEGLKFGIEHFRRRKPHCSGTLVWQLNDCWPVLSWSLLDYYGFGKAGYFYVKRAYAPVLASIKALEDGAVELWITNDTLQEVREVVTIRSGSFAGEIDWEDRLPVQVARNTSVAVWSGDPDRIVARPDRYLAVRSESERFPGNRHFFVAIKDLQRRIVAPEITISSRSNDELAVQVQARAYLFYFHICMADERTRYSDNYFDLAPGERRTVSVTIPGSRIEPDLLSLAWR
jgi:beta-mannosidase